MKLRWLSSGALCVADTCCQQTGSDSHAKANDLSATLLSCLATPALAVDPTPSSDATAMGNALTGTGFHLTGATLTTDTQNGFFTNGSAIGINQGVVLTTGSLNCVGNSNTSGSCTGGGSGSTLDLTFTLDSSSLFFNYVFGSEEYNEYVGSGFNDFFQLLLNGPGFSNVNLAQIPGGGGPVTIDNVNNGSNSTFYNDNAGGAFAFELDGFTDVLTASASGLTPGESYTLSFIIGDVGDLMMIWPCSSRVGPLALSRHPRVQCRNRPPGRRCSLASGRSVRCFGAANPNVRRSSRPDSPLSNRMA